MKKLCTACISIAFIFALVIPAAAVEHTFGGYFRTRAYQQTDFDGAGTQAQDLTQTDSRARLYYTAKFSDNFKFVNKFEFDNTWGDTVGGDIGADGKIFEVKNSYVDFKLSPLHFKVGTQGTKIARGFFFDDDFSGLVLTYKGETYSVPFIWVKAYEGGEGKDMNDQDVDYYCINPMFKFGAFSVNPFFIMGTSSDASAWGSTAAYKDFAVSYIGVNIDAKFGTLAAWLTGISESGDGDDATTGASHDISGTLIALGASTPLGPVTLKAEIIHASGDANAADNEREAFWVPKGQSYYWAEIMGYGIFDNQVSAGSCADRISNLQSYNIGVSYKPMKHMTITADLWNASLAEAAAGADDDLGTEIDLRFTYKFLENLTLDVVAAKLFAGDATGGGKEDPTEIGTRLSISF